MTPATEPTPAAPGHAEQGDYFANHARARQFPWTLYHQPLERDLAKFLRAVAADHPTGEVLVVGCGLLHELDAAPAGLRFHVCDIDARAVEAVVDRHGSAGDRGDARVAGGTVVAVEAPIDRYFDRQFVAVYAKEVVEHVLAWPAWLAGLRRALVPGGRLWLSTPNYGEPWLPALESTVLELIARKSGFSRRHLHPTRFSKRSLRRGLVAAGFDDVAVHTSPTRLALTSWARAPR